MFTLIAYRPNGSDSCMGCHMGSSDSELEITYHGSTDSLSEAYLKIRKQEFQDRNEREISSYVYTILCNGRDILDISVDFDQEMFTELNSLAEKEQKIWLQQEEDALALKRQREHTVQREHDLAELARIQQRLGLTG